MGDGAGRGGNGGDLPRYARAEWIKPPSAADFRRHWPSFATRIKAPVDAVMACSVKPNGRPFRCKLLLVTLPRNGFGTAALEVVQNTLVRPVQKNGQPLDGPVLIRITFRP